MPDWLGALLAMGLIMAVGMWFSRARQPQPVMQPTPGSITSPRVQQWQWAGAGVGFLVGLMRATGPWQGAGLFDNLMEALVMAFCAALIARATRQWLDTRRP